MGEAQALEVRQASKAYATPVLCDVDFDLRSGEIHALVGGNGAGKSTLARIICGLTPADAGSMLLFGRQYAPRSKAQSEHAGVHIVQQELNLIPTLSVGENLFLNRMPRRFGFVRQGELHRRAAEALKAVGMQNVHPGTPVSSLGVARQQLVEIASALSRRLRVLILDEPTATLTRPEIDLLFMRLRELRAQGIAMIYISHRMEEIRAIADRVTTLRDGRMVETCPASEASVERLVSLMIGARTETAATEEGAPRRIGPIVMTVSQLNRGALVRDISFELRQGEILGLSGLVGSGRTETLRAIYGADRPSSGIIAVGDPPRPVRIRSPHDAVRFGIGMLPEDRKMQGLLLPHAVAMNVTLARMRDVSFGGGALRAGRERQLADRYRESLAIRCDSVEQPVLRLSGGNQQKVLVARWLMRDCRVLLCDEPTRGIDVGAREMIYGLLRGLARAGKALLVASSDLNELMVLCDRIAVISAGDIAATFVRGEWTEDKIMTAAFSRYAASEAAG